MPDLNSDATPVPSSADRDEEPTAFVAWTIWMDHLLRGDAPPSADDWADVRAAYVNFMGALRLAAYCGRQADELELLAVDADADRERRIDVCMMRGALAVGLCDAVGEPTTLVRGDIPASEWEPRAQAVGEAVRHFLVMVGRLPRLDAAPPPPAPEAPRG
ncbi:hypothetical protein tb265_50250 [Gemmatimonadetes bacterium T265]|nr:hypothetical protein tb265_50250 [Gemmatimonadetes bacterium T265]